nr:transmembrane protein 209 [Tanacetum cinerariifolium]
VMEAAAKLGISVTISKVGIDLTAQAIAKVTFNERYNNWQPVYTLDEEGLLLQLRTTLVQTLDSTSRSPLGGFQQIQAHNPSIPVVQECLLPPKEQFPEKYLAVVSGVPSVLHPGAC